MKISGRRIMVSGALLMAIAISSFILFTATRPPVRLELAADAPVKRMQFANDSGRELNYFFFAEVRSNGLWVYATPQPVGARGARNAKPNSVQELVIDPTPQDEMPWRLRIKYQPALQPWYFSLAERVGVLKNYRAHYFDFRTVEKEFTR